MANIRGFRRFLPSTPTLRLEQSLSLAAFVMSLGIALINAYYGLRGADIVASAPEQLIFYRDGEGADSVLTVAVRTELVNVASDYGDVLRSATLRIERAGAVFDDQASLQTIFTGGATTPPECEPSQRCLSLPGLFVTERTDEMFDIPGGGAKAVTLAFPVVAWNCATKDKRCAAAADFQRALALIPAKGAELTLTLKFQTDGERQFRCRIGDLDRAYLAKIGWVSRPCE